MDFEDTERKCRGCGDSIDVAVEGDRRVKDDTKTLSQQICSILSMCFAEYGWTEAQA